MRLSAKPIKNFVNINAFDFGSEWRIRQDEPNTLYLQLIDLDRDGLRYMPTDASYSVSVSFPGTEIVKVATQESALDRSIWKVSLSSTEKVYSGNVQVSVTEAGVTRRFSILQGLAVEQLSDGGC